MVAWTSKNYGVGNWNLVLFFLVNMHVQLGVMVFVICKVYIICYKTCSIMFAISCLRCCIHRENVKFINCACILQCHHFLVSYNTLLQCYISSTHVVLVHWTYTRRQGNLGEDVEIFFYKFWNKILERYKENMHTSCGCCYIK
jgi:hypothetical protein